MTLAGRVLLVATKPHASQRWHPCRCIRQGARGVVHFGGARGIEYLPDHSN